MSIIRKIVIGIDYKNGMSFQVGQELNIMSGGIKHLHKIQEIIRRQVGGPIEIYVKSMSNEGSIYLWKEVNTTTPFVLEFDLNFD